MSTQGPQQPQPAKADPDMRLLNLVDPPGGIATIGRRSHSVQYLPYPLLKPPIIMSTPNLDQDWVDASKEEFIFTHPVPSPDRIRLLQKKQEHFQYYFWTALDRARRLGKPLDGSVRLWEYHDLQGMLTWWRMCRQVTIPSRIGESNDGLWREVLLGSPWFDSPVFWDLLWKVAVDHNGKPRLDGNGEVIMKPRDPRSGVLEMRFFDRWWLTASRLPLRRFENGDAVLPITMAYYQAQNGTEGNQWFIPRFM